MIRLRYVIHFRDDVDPAGLATEFLAVGWVSTPSEGWHTNHRLYAQKGAREQNCKINYGTTNFTNNKQIAYKAAGNIPLTFSVTKKLKGTHSSYEVQGPTCPESASSMYKIFDAIDRCLENRPKSNDLEQTLEMIAAYKDLRTTKCDVCNELLGKGGLTPAARRSKTVKGLDGAETQKWVSIHEGCLLP